MAKPEDKPLPAAELKALQDRLRGRYFLAPWDATDSELLVNMGRHIASRQWPVLRERCLKVIDNG